MIRRLGDAHPFGGDHPRGRKVAELGERPREMAAGAHRRQADLPHVLLLVRGIDQRHGARQERLRLRIVAERAVDLARAHVADEQQVDRADAFAEDERALARFQREIGMADVAVVVAEERVDLRLPPFVAQLVGEPLRGLQDFQQPLMLAERNERIAQVAVEVERGFERALGRRKALQHVQRTLVIAETASMPPSCAVMRPASRR